jgi:hypothetical protein
MISDKQLPSFYIVEATGGAVNAIIPGDLGIESITVGSSDFPNDMLALGGLESTMTYVTDKLTVPVEENKDFNPEFFPTLHPAKLSHKQKLEQEMLDEHIEQLQATLSKEGKVAIPITKRFDELGDFVQTRWTVKGENLLVTARLIANPHAYMKEKEREITEPMNKMGPAGQANPKITVH